MVPIYVEYWGDNLQILPQFCTIFNIGGGIKLNHSFFHVSKSSEGQKKGLHQNLKNFCPRNQVKTKQKVQRSSSAQMQTIVKLLGDISPPGFGTLAYLPRKQISLPLTQSICKTPPLSLNPKPQGKNLCF